MVANHINSALTLEWLETTFYQQGFAKFPASDFMALGLNAVQVSDLMGIGASEAAHVGVLQSAVANAGVKPVLPCTYNFNAAFASPMAMLQTASVLEQVGVSAYLGAAPIVADPSILGTAASILTVEARHQSFTRVASNLPVAPNQFDTPLSPKQVFSLAAPFIVSCPQGSNLVLTAFPNITMTAPAANTQLKVGDVLALQSTAAPQATACAFTVGGAPGGTVFSAFSNGACATPPNIGGTVYLNLVKSIAADGKITDDNIVAGPMILSL